MWKIFGLKVEAKKYLEILVHKEGLAEEKVEEFDEEELERKYRLTDDGRLKERIRMVLLADQDWINLSTFLNELLTLIEAP